MADYEMVAKETLALSATVNRQVQWVRSQGGTLPLLATAKVPGGSTGYRHDVEPYDHRMLIERLSRKIRLETLGLSPGGGD